MLVSADDEAFDAAEIPRVVEAVIQNVKRYYFDSNAAQQIAEALRAHETSFVMLKHFGRLGVHEISRTGSRSA